MSETTQIAAKAAKPVPPILRQGPQTLRETKTKTFAPSALKPLGYGETEIMTLTVPAEWTFEDVMNPKAWVSVVGPIAANDIKTQIDRVGSLIYLNTADNRFTAWLRISRICRDELKKPCGLEALCIGPSIDLKTGRPCPMDLRTGLAWVDPAKPEDKVA